MALTELQLSLCRLIARQRLESGESYVAGGVALNAATGAARISKTYTTFMVNTESTYDWQGRQWTVPLNFMFDQMQKVGKQPISLQLGYRYYAVKPDGGADWGLRFAVTLLFGK